MERRRVSSTSKLSSQQQKAKLRLIVAIAAAGLIDKDEDTEQGVQRLLKRLGPGIVQLPIQQSIETEAKRVPLNEVKYSGEEITRGENEQEIPISQDTVEVVIPETIPGEKKANDKKEKVYNSGTLEVEAVSSYGGNVVMNRGNMLRPFSLFSQEEKNGLIDGGPSTGLMLHLLSFETPVRVQNFMKKLPQRQLFSSFPNTMKSLLSVLQLNKASGNQRLDVLMMVIKVLNLEYSSHILDDIQFHFDSAQDKVQNSEIEKKYNITEISMRNLYKEIFSQLKKMELSTMEVDNCSPDDPFIDVNDDIEFFIKLSIFTAFILKIGVQIYYCKNLLNEIIVLILEIVGNVIRGDRIEHVIAVSFLINGLTEAFNIGGYIKHDNISSIISKLIDIPDTGKDSYLILIPKLWYLIHDKFINSSLTVPSPPVSVVTTITNVSGNNNDENDNNSARVTEKSDNTINSNLNSPISNSLTQQSLALR